MLSIFMNLDLRLENYEVMYYEIIQKFELISQKFSD